MKNQCLAICRDGLPCWHGTYQHSSLYFWRTAPITTVFCREHDDEYRILLGKYTHTRFRCQSYRWVFTTRPYELDHKTYDSLKTFEKICRSALFIIGEALELRALRSQRFAAAFDEFANDEPVEQLRDFMQHCVSLLQYCLSLMRLAPRRVSVLQSIVRTVGTVLRGPEHLRRRISQTYEMDSKAIGAPIDLASTYFGPFGAALEVVQIVQNLIPEAVVSRIRDPMKAENIAKRATIRKRLSTFLVSQHDIVDQLGHETVINIREALFRRLIIEDQLLLRPLKNKTYLVEELLNDKLATHTDLERLWTATALLNPATLRDALIDLAYLADRKISKESVNQDRTLEALPARSWKVLHIITGNRMNFADVYFLCATAQEFMNTMILATFHESQFSSLLPRGSTADDPLMLCMRAFGLFITYCAREDDREIMVGLMENNSSTRTFARTLSSKCKISIRVRYSNGTIFRNDHTLEDLSTEHDKDNPRAIKVNLETISGQPIKHLHRRTGQYFRDGFEIRLASRSNQQESPDAWKLELVHDLALVQTGRRDVCSALDYSFERVRRQSISSFIPSFSKDRRYVITTQQSLATLKLNYSQRTLDSTHHLRSSSINENATRYKPEHRALHTRSATIQYNRLSRHQPFNGSPQFQHVSTQNNTPMQMNQGPLINYNNSTGDDTRQRRLAKSKFKEHLSLSTQFSLSKLETDIQEYKTRVHEVHREY